MAMEILSAQAVREAENQKRQNEEQRVQNLLTEEARLVRSVNGLRDEESEAKRDTEAMAVKVEALRNDIQVLEAKKTEALKPIQDVREEADQRIGEAIRRENAVADEEERQKASRAECQREAKAAERDRLAASNLLAGITERSNALSLQEGAVGGRERAVEDRERQLDEQTRAKEAEMQEREEAVQARTRELAIREDAVARSEVHAERSERDMERRQAELGRYIKEKQAEMEKQESIIAERSNSLKNEWVAFQERVQRVEADLARRERIVVAKEPRLAKLERDLNERVEGLNMYEKRLIEKDKDLNPRSKLNKSH